MDSRSSGSFHYPDALKLPNLSPFIRGFKVMINDHFRSKPSIEVLPLQSSDTVPKPGALLNREALPRFSSGSASSPDMSGSSSSALFRLHAPASTPSSFGSTGLSQRSDSQISISPPERTLEQSSTTSCSSLAEDSDLASDSFSIFDSDSEDESGATVSQV
jgi:hypothetical protein